MRGPLTAGELTFSLLERRCLIRATAFSLSSNAAFRSRGLGAAFLTVSASRARVPCTMAVGVGLNHEGCVIAKVRIGRRLYRKTMHKYGCTLPSLRFPNLEFCQPRNAV
jgi:hypothetical protein